MISIKGLTARNFLSIGNVTQALRLDDPGLTLVLGRNLDIGGENSRNGVGKTTILQAISYGLFGQPLSEIKQDNLINSINAKQMLVTIEFERDGKSYRIERGRKPNVLRFISNEEAIENDEAQGENKHTQTEIERLLGMTHLLFQHIVGMNTYTVPFLQLKPAQQREVIEELLGITTLSLRDEALSKVTKDTRDALRDEEAVIKASTEANSRIQAAIERAVIERQSWVRDQAIRVAAIGRKADDLSRIDFDTEIAKFDEVEAWLTRQREFAATMDIHVREADLLHRELARLDADAARLKQDRDAVTDRQIDRLQDEAARFDLESIMGIGNHVHRMAEEAKRCDAEALKGCEDKIALLRRTADRHEAASQEKLALARAKSLECDALLAEYQNADGHSCSTCGQSLNGTDHLQQVMAKLLARIEAAEGERHRAQIAATAESLDCDLAYDEIKEVEISHGIVQQGWRDKAQAIRTEIEQETAAWEVRAAEFRAKAAVVRVEIEEAKARLQSRRSELQAKLDEIAADRALVIDAEAEMEAQRARLEFARTMLGPQPEVSYGSKEEVWRLRESRDVVLAELAREQARANPHDAHIASLEDTLAVIDTAVRDDLADTLKHHDFLHKLLTGKDSFVRKRIIDANLLYLNTQVNHYLGILGLPHEVRFQPDLGVEISMLGKDFDFPQLSRGERNRVMLATSWAFRDVWEGLNTSLNLLVCDEQIDSGMDESGALAALDVLTAMGRKKAVFLISHKESLIGQANRILLVSKENQFTRFEFDATF